MVSRLLEMYGLGGQPQYSGDGQTVSTADFLPAYEREAEYRASIPGRIANWLDRQRPDMNMQGGGATIHGSPHDFDKFDMSKIGTGEGAQAYGHGLYFAENEGVARSYRDNLAGRDYSRDGQAFTPRNAAEQEVETALWASGGDLEKAIGELTQRRGFIDDPVWTQRYDDAIKAAEEMKAAGGYSTTPKGRMYEVRINADPNEFLDWDLPLSQQSEKVRDAMNRLANGEILSTDTGEQAYRSAAMQIGGRKFLEDPELSSRVSEAGIPGIRYLDQQSRAAGEGSRNYVLFRDDIVEIVKKYGIAAAVSMYGLDAVQGVTQDQSDRTH